MKSRTDRSVEKQFWIRACDDSVVALAAGANPELANGDIAAQTFDDFRRVTAEWALARFVGIWNRLPGKTPVRRFKDRATAVHRIWSGIQDISPEVPPPSDFIEPPEVTGREGTKKEHLLVLLARRDGASIAEVMAALWWETHLFLGWFC